MRYVIWLSLARVFAPWPQRSRTAIYVHIPHPRGSKASALSSHPFQTTTNNGQFLRAVESLSPTLSVLFPTKSSTPLQAYFLVDLLIVRLGGLRRRSFLVGRSFLRWHQASVSDLPRCALLSMQNARFSLSFRAHVALKQTGTCCRSAEWSREVIPVVGALPTAGRCSLQEV